MDFPAATTRNMQADVGSPTVPASGTPGGMSEEEIRYPPWDGGDDQLENDLPQWKATTQDIMRQVDAVKGHRQKYVTYPDGTRYRVKRAKDADYTTDTGHEVEVWELVPEP